MISNVSVVELAEKVRRQVRPERYEHILRVAELAAEIAKANGLDVGKTYLAAILHDAARDLSAEQLEALAPPLIELERQHPLALHGRAGRRLAQEWGIDDEEMLEAIEGHVYGVAPDHKIGMALYVADVSEPGRGVNHDIREMALAGRLEEAYQKAVICKVKYLQSKGIEPHPRTLAAYRAILQQLGSS
ncbi:bis(5'-nucleosyl)-tetraphosphatase (symmetrical) YqeK [Meiothermus sp.]|uniref:bis(5'-nucleosyl)-tetraphosphatase (symmetrical) YqeK n=1 Tax=Meiothermus sp. TaxID=1955249 RepID=UPI0021DF0682|nr:bis(5'-nucleosyl)-tetraphosphatase (symmetrical) YqeK [Meiothermus sp.]GIW25512.1 MAG: phosphohydrolase [Meiothermus sp.]